LGYADTTTSRPHSNTLENGDLKQSFQDKIKKGPSFAEFVQAGATPLSFSEALELNDPVSTDSKFVSNKKQYDPFAILCVASLSLDKLLF
jgi:hypothetical protein